MTRHVIWDWNGTLCDDLGLVLGALNDTLAGFEIEEVTEERYRALYCRPVDRFYERLLGRPVTADEWRFIDDHFHDVYLERLHAATLTHDAEVALEAVVAAGRTQSLLSMFRHDELVPLVERLGIASHFLRIDGLRGPGGGTKHVHLEAHLAAVAHAAGDDPRRVVVIGDALDDALAASHVGARCVLYDGGSHPRAELEATGFPVVDRLADAVDAAIDAA